MFYFSLRPSVPATLSFDVCGFALPFVAIIELLRWGTSGVTPRNNFFLELLFTPLTVIIGGGFRVWIDHVVRSGAKKNKKAQ